MHAESRGAREAEVSIFEAGDLTIDLGRQRVTRAGQEIALPKLSFDLLLALVRAAPNIATLDSLMQEVWPTVVVSPETLSQRVKLLRDALQDDSREPRYIETLRSRGYRFMQPVVRHALQAEQAPVLETPPTMSRWSGRRIAAVCAVLVAVATIVTLIARSPTEQRAGSNIPSSIQSLPAHTVAVLPFHDASTVPGGELIAFGIAEGLLHRLASVRNLTLIARASSFAAAEPSKDAREIGRRLNARYLVEGSVAIRDAALAGHRPAAATAALKARLAQGQNESAGVYRWGTTLALAQVRKIAGQREEAEALARSLLDESTTKLPHRIEYAKPAAYAVLEQNDAAMEALAANVSRGHVRRWWYTFEREPVLRTALGNDPRFLSLSARVRQHASAQRALLDGMRDRGEIPLRKINGKSANNPC